MDIFLSYASEQRAQAEEIALALRAEGHTVFFDRSELPEGEGYNARIREAIGACDLVVFLVSPASVAAGRYTLTELGFAEKKWRSPARHVLPVLVEPTDKAAIPAYLRAVVMLRPTGNVAAEVAAAADRMLAPGWLRLLRRSAIPLAVVMLAAAGYGGWRGVTHARICGQAEQRAREAGLQRDAGDYAAAWDGYTAALALCPGSDPAQGGQERLAMLWLENARGTEGKETFTDIADRVQPVLARAAASDDDGRAADALAHLGWADFLRTRDGRGGLDPAGYYRQALGRDPGNPYAHAFLGHHTLANGGGVEDAMRHFDGALAVDSLRPFVRRIQIGALTWRRAPELEDALVRVANEMRTGNEGLPALAGESVLSSFWNVWYGALVNGERKDAFLAVLSPPDHLATYDWLFTAYDNPSNRVPWRLMRAVLQENAGDRAGALASYESVRSTLTARGADGRLLDAAERALRRLDGR